MYIVRIEMLIKPVNRFAIRKMAKPLALMASRSGGTAELPEELRQISMIKYPKRNVVLYAATQST
jgi:hypothetical protein